MHTNLISGYILNKVGIKMMFGLDKLILTEGGDYTGRGYACNAGLFVLDTTYEVASNVESASPSACIAESLEM